MGRQYKRVANVLVGKAGSGVLIKDLRISFEVVKATDSTPNSATIKIYNMSPDNQSKIKKEFTDVFLSAGYEDNVRLVFRGNIRHAYTYREGNDIITEIDAGDGDRDYREAVMNETLAAGTTDKQLIERAASSMTNGTTLGYTDASDKARTRGKVLTGNTRNVLSKIATGSNATWSIQDGVLQLVSVAGVLPTEAIVLNNDTGLLKAPKITEDGVETISLLNPEIAINGRIKVNNRDVDTRPPGGGADSGGPDKKPLPNLSADGFYKVIKLTHKGDTHGSEWTSVATAVAL